MIKPENDENKNEKKIDEEQKNEEENEDENVGENEEENEDENEDENEEENGENEEEKKENKIKRRKKTRHYFEHHIRKILKQITKDKDITYEARSELNDVAVYTCKNIKQKTKQILDSLNRKTITDEEIEMAVKLVFDGQLCQKCCEEGSKCVDQYKKYQQFEKKERLEKNILKPDIIIPHSVIAYILRDKNPINISFYSSIYLAGVIEYFLSQIIESAIISSNKKSKRITVDEIERGIQSDSELLSYFTKYNMILFGSNLSSYGTPYFNQNKKIENERDFIFSKSFFENRFKHYISLVHPDIRYQKDCFTYIQDYIEKWVFSLIKYSTVITKTIGKVRLSDTEIEIVHSILSSKTPDFLKNEFEFESDSIPFDA